MDKSNAQSWGLIHNPYHSRHTTMPREQDKSLSRGIEY